MFLLGDKSHLQFRPRARLCVLSERENGQRKVE